MQTLITEFFAELNMLIDIIYFQVFGAIKREDEGCGYVYSLNPKFNQIDFVKNMIRLKNLLLLTFVLFDINSEKNEEFMEIVDQLYDSEEVMNVNIYTGKYINDLLVQLNNIQKNNQMILSNLLSPNSKITLEELIKDWKFNVAKMYVITDYLMAYLNIDLNVVNNIDNIQKNEIHNKYIDMDGYKLIYWTKVDNIFYDEYRK